jgi:hypothetical protein
MSTSSVRYRELTPEEPRRDKEGSKAFLEQDDLF